MVELSIKRTEVILVSLAFFLVAYFYLGANIFAGEIVAPMDLLLQFSGFKESGFNLTVMNSWKSDVLDQLLPRWIINRESILKGELALWNSLTAGGEPSFFHLPNYCVSLGFLVFLIAGDGLGFTLALLTRLIVAGIGSYFLCRTRLDVLPSVFGGLTYMMCGFNAAWLMWPQVETSAWIPWVLWSVIRLDEKPNMQRMVILSFTIAALIFAGFPSLAGYTLYVALLFGLWLLVSKYWIKRNIRYFKNILWIFGGIGFGFALASIELIPLLEYVQQFDISWRRAGSIPIHNIILLIDPFRFGQPYVEKTGYVGFLPLFLALFAILYSFRKRTLWRGPFSPLFWSTLTILTLILIYRTPEFLAELIYKLPVFSNNPNTRLLALFGLELAILGAVGLQIFIDKTRSILYFSSGKSARIILVMILLILGIHIIDVTRVGRSQNAVVPSETFFPDTPSIKYVQEKILPGQSVLATGEAFLISGTLTAYELPEWFAHTYHKQEEKVFLEKIVKSPWASPTAARFYFYQIDMNSPLMDAFGIRYILTSTKSFYTYIAQIRHDKPAPSMPQNVLGQVWNIKESVNITGIELQFATYERPTAEGILTLTLYKNGEVISESSVNGNLIKDNHWVRFNFNKILSLHPGDYSFEIIQTAPEAPPVTIWTRVNKDEFKDGYMTVNGIPAEGDLTFIILGTPAARRSQIFNDWNVLTPGEEIVIFERKNSPPGAYFLHENASFDKLNPHLLSWEEVKLIHHSANSQMFSVNTNSTGWLVRTVRFWPGWNCYVNGTLTDSEPYLDVFPAVQIPAGNYIVECRYEPLSLKVGAIITFSALSIILAYFFHYTLKRTDQKVLVSQKSHNK